MKFKHFSNSPYRWRPGLTAAQKKEIREAVARAVQITKQLNKERSAAEDKWLAKNAHRSFT